VNDIHRPFRLLWLYTTDDIAGALSLIAWSCAELAHDCR